MANYCHIFFKILIIFISFLCSINSKTSTILDEIVLKTRERYSFVGDKEMDLIKEKAEKRKINNSNFFYDAINKRGISFICEVKKASPSKGIISEDFPYLNIAKEYNKYCDVISCLTEPFYFLGSSEYLSNIKKNINIPILRKDFIISQYQIYEAKDIGADAILLIVAILKEEELIEFLNLAHSIGLGVLVEAHDEKEVIQAIKIGAKVIGVNNRNLKDFSVDMNNSIKLRRMAPNNIKFISESGIKTRNDVKILENNNVDGILIGESLMRSKNIEETIHKLKFD